MNWYTVSEGGEDTERLVNAWNDAPIENLEVLGMVLETARDQVLAYAPEPAALPEGTPVPDPPARYVLAQLRQAQSIWDAGRVSSDGNLGDGAFVFTPRPMDKTIKQIIRPADGKPHVL